MENYAECGKPISADNPSYSGGGNLSATGRWSTWKLGVCCRKPLTAEDLQQHLQAVFAAQFTGTP